MLVDRGVGEWEDYPCMIRARRTTAVAGEKMGFGGGTRFYTNDHDHDHDTVIEYTRTQSVNVSRGDLRRNRFCTTVYNI